MVSRGSQVKKDMKFGQPLMILSTPDDDAKNNIDVFIGNLKVALRRRRIKLSKYGEISIRNSRNSGAKTELEKILAGESKSELYIFSFRDAYIVCTLKDIYNCLLNKKYHTVPNPDKETTAAYISLSDINHLSILKNSVKVNATPPPPPGSGTWE